MPTTTPYGGITTPKNDTDSNDPGAYLLAMANSFDAHLVQQFTSIGTRDSATAAHIAAGKRIVCWVGGNVGLCAHNGTTWVNLSPPIVKQGSRNYGSGQEILNSAYWEDPTTVITFPNVLNGQLMDIDVHASIRIDGSFRQTVNLAVVAAGSIQQTQPLAPYMSNQTYGDGNEYITYHSKLRLFLDNGTINLKVAVQNGNGGSRLVLQQAQVWATLFPAAAV